MTGTRHIASGTPPVVRRAFDQRLGFSADAEDVATDAVLNGLEAEDSVLSLNGGYEWGGGDDVDSLAGKADSGYGVCVLGAGGLVRGGGGL